MTEATSKVLFKKGIWIKEQQGNLTIGSLDKTEKDIKIIPEQLKKVLIDFENDMLEALYGERSVDFEPGRIDIVKMFDQIAVQFNAYELKISFSGTDPGTYQGDYNAVYRIIERFVLSSLPTKDTDSQSPIIYINASLTDNHLCIIYRDSGSLCHPSKLKKEIEYIQKKLNGSVNYKAKSGEKSYFDIMIPSTQ